MSNRIRILFHCNLDGQLAHMGRRALEALEGHVASQNAEWVSDRTWSQRGSPKILERKLTYSEKLGRAVYKYLVARPAPGPEAERPAFKTVLERVQWLWQNLPPEIRQQSSLLVTREGRNSNWRNSRANPTKYGWSRRRKSPQATAGNLWENPWKAVDSVLYGNSFVIGTPPTASPLEVPKLNIDAKLAKLKTKQRLKKSPYLHYNKAAKKVEWATLEEPGEFIEVEDGQLPQPSGIGIGQAGEGPASPNAKAKPQAGGKNKLRIGIWA